MSTGKAWSREQLVIVCGFYFTLPFGQMHARNPRVVRLAKLLGRTPGSVAMKLVNFASLDPEHQARGVRGLRGTSHADQDIWDEFRQDWNKMSLTSEKALQHVEAKHGKAVELPEMGGESSGMKTETERTLLVRTMQGYFRKVILAAYNSRCCVTGNPVEDLLTASHILPWSSFPAERLNPRNGLCLSAHFDRAFDRGLIAFDDDFRLIVSPALRVHLPNEAIQHEFIDREGRSLEMPERFPPEREFLAVHRQTVFRSRKTLHS